MVRAVRNTAGRPEERQQDFQKMIASIYMTVLVIQSRCKKDKIEIEKMKINHY